MYEAYLETEGIEHTEQVFEQFLHENGKKICAEHGEITYVDGEVKCIVYAEEDGHVPLL